MQEPFRKEINGMIEKNKGKSHDEIIDGLVEQKYFSVNSGQSIKQYIKDLQTYLNSIPEKDNVMNWCVDKEDAIRSDKALSSKEKIQILSHQALVRYALKWKMELMGGGVKSGRVLKTNDFWSDLACWVGAISGFGGAGSSIATTVSYFNNAGQVGALATAAPWAVLGGAIGVAFGIINAVITCSGSVCTTVCQDPASVALPYKCYNYGDPLLFEAVGYGDANNHPSQFVFNFTYNNNLNNLLYSNFTSNDYMWLSGSDIVSHGATSVAVKCQTNCSNGNPLWFGWFTLSDLGKPYFTISGNSNFNVSDIPSPYSSEVMSYFASGPINSTNASIQWEIVPSGYPNYSATGTIQWGANSSQVGIKWDQHAGYANLKCTTIVACATIVNYYTIHIN